MFKRNIKPRLENGLKKSPIVLLTGARQTGKTTLMKELGKERKYNYVTFDQNIAVFAAKEDPEGYILGLRKPVILDEVQRVPEIFLPIKLDVDENREPGRYGITGSANPFFVSSVGDALPGRMVRYSLYPLSQGELIDKRDDFIDYVFENDLVYYDAGSFSREDLCNTLVVGGYPMSQEIDERDRAELFQGYVTSILERDVRDITHITAIRELERVLEMLAARVGNVHNVADVSRSTKLPYTSLQRYIALLEALYLIDFLPAWSNNLTKRLVRSPKVYMVDSGLLTYLLRTDAERLLLDSRLTGSIFENFVVAEIRKQSTWCNKLVRMYHYRSQKGAEVDVVLEDTKGKIVGIEVKYSDSLSTSDLKGLYELRDIARDKFVKGIILYTGKETIPFGKDMYALPVDALWRSSM